MTFFFCPTNVMLRRFLSLPFFFSFSRMDSFLDYSLRTIRILPMSAMFARA